MNADQRKLHSRIILKAHEILQRPADQRTKSLKECGWETTELPTLDELALHIMLRCMVASIETQKPIPPQN